MWLSVAAIYGLCFWVIIDHSLGASSGRPKVGVRIKGKVTDVISGKSFVLTRHGQAYLVQIAGLDEPGRHSEWHDVASWALVGKLLGKRVSVLIENVEPNGSLTGVVTRGNRDVGLAMIKEGHGRAERKSPMDFSLMVAERGARRNGKGMWRSSSKEALSEDRISQGCKGR